MTNTPEIIDQVFSSSSPGTIIKNAVPGCGIITALFEGAAKRNLVAVEIRLDDVIAKDVGPFVPEGTDCIIVADHGHKRDVAKKMFDMANDSLRVIHIQYR